jgi:hypothetical protein
MDRLEMHKKRSSTADIPVDSIHFQLLMRNVLFRAPGVSGEFDMFRGNRERKEILGDMLLAISWEETGVFVTNCT